ncbi:MAG: branched-chain amino acid ABC transporter permease [Stellaceae bacterium]
MSIALSVATDAVLLTLTLVLATLGLAVIYGLIGVINMGHGALITLGAYFTWLATGYGVPFAPAVVLAAIGVGVIGLVFEHVIVRHFYDKPLDTLLLTWGFFLVTTEVIKILFGANIKSVANPLPGAWTAGAFALPAYQSVISVISLVLLGAVALTIHRTALGIKIRALVQHREMASLLGLNVGHHYKLVFTAGAVLAGLAGALLSPLISVQPDIGNIYLIRAFFVVIVGGVGQLFAGTLVGSFLVGGSKTIISLGTSQVVAQTVVFALAILVLRFRPSGVLAAR